MNIIYIGTPEYVVPPLEAVLDSGHDIPMVVTPPDVVSGRGQTEKAPPLKKAALDRGLHVYQPESINDSSAVERLSREEPDVFIVASFGKILAPSVLDIPEQFAMNIHPSCLPNYRGPAPVAHSILDGLEQTCVTFFKMNEEMDEGPIIEQKQVSIKPDETTGQLRRRLFEVAAEHVPQVLDQIAHHSVTFQEQDPDEGSYAPFLSREDGQVDWTKTSTFISRQIRAMKPWPETFSWLETGEQNSLLRLKIIWGEPRTSVDKKVEPGEIAEVNPDGIRVQTGDGTVVVQRVQPENKQEMGIRDFINGFQPEPGDRFHSTPAAK